MYRSRDPQKEIVAAFSGLGLSPGIKTIIIPKGQGNV
jgi:hypothetical protein